MRSDRDRLQDILQAIQEIESYISEGEEFFQKNKLTQSAVIYQLIIIGEATGDIDRAIKERYPNIEWKNIIGMRDILAHQYFKIDRDLVWLTIIEKLPTLKIVVQTILAELATD